MIGILDLDMGNLRSVAKAVYELGYDPLLIREEGQFEALSHLIIPGVGNFATAIQRLDAMNLRGAVENFKASQKPILGICLGMQILADFGEEGGFSKGLGFIPGGVKKLELSSNYPLPHVGWNEICFEKKHPVLSGVRDYVDFYFVHSYEFVAQDEQDVIGRTDYGKKIAAIVGHENVLGFQFHPEKSQGNGLKLIENFCRWDGQC